MKDFVKNVAIGILLFAVVVFLTKENYQSTIHLPVSIPQAEIVDGKLQVIDIDPEKLWTTPDSQVQYLADMKTILISGAIVPEMLPKFKKLLNRDIKLVAIASPGGDLKTSINIANIVREKKYDTMVPYSSMCYSGCTLIFQAGQHRIAYSNSMLMYHSAKFVHPKTGKDTISEAGTALFWGNLIALGVSSDMFGLMGDLNTDYYISAKNSTRYHIVNELIMVDNADGIKYL